MEKFYINQKFKKINACFLLIKIGQTLGKKLIKNFSMKKSRIFYEHLHIYLYSVLYNISNNIYIIKYAPTLLSNPFQCKNNLLTTFKISQSKRSIPRNEPLQFAWAGGHRWGRWTTPLTPVIGYQQNFLMMTSSYKNIYFFRLERVRKLDSDTWKYDSKGKAQ